MTELEKELASAVAAGPPGLLAYGRELAGANNREELSRASAWLLDSVPPSLGAPWAAYFSLLATDTRRAIDGYARWLEDAEAPAAFHLGQFCRACGKHGDPDLVFGAAARFHPWDLDFEAREVAARAMQAALRFGSPAAFRPLRIALLATFNARPLVSSLVVGATRLGLHVLPYLPEAGHLHLEVMNPDSGLYAHRPDVVILATSWRDVTDKAAAEQADEWTRLWQIVRERTGAHLLQHTFDRPPLSPLGHLEARVGHSRRRLAQEVNVLLAERAADDVSLVDYEQVVFRRGARAFCDDRQWFWAKEAVAAAAAPELVEEYLAILRPLSGRSYKVCVLDLDNTLWGGVVGEIGVSGLKLGPPSAEGEAFLSLQRYLLALKKRGVLLAVCSKNNPEDARAPFEELPDMALGLSDFVAFDAGWDAKPTALRRLSAALNLGLQSFVFVDDNPAERALMRRENPDVLSIPLPDDPVAFLESLDRARAFETLSFTEEDGQRTEHYRAEQRRRALGITMTALPEYYRSLEMVAQVGSFTAAEQTRVVQLASRSNQFNLTTWRITPGDYQRLCSDPRYETRTVRLRDRFGDYGLVMVLVAEIKADLLDILAYFMSCRVIGRTLEDLALAEFDAMARARGCREIRGTFMPTKKNRELVADLYPRLGFERVSGEDGQATVWRRRVSATAAGGNPYIRIERAEEQSR
jgi:FkbH-like protein